MVGAGDPQVYSRMTSDLIELSDDCSDAGDPQTLLPEEDRDHVSV